MNFINSVIDQKILCNETPLSIHFRHDGSNDELDMISNIVSSLYNHNNEKIAICSEFQDSFYHMQICKKLKSTNTNINITKDTIFSNIKNHYKLRGHSLSNLIIHISYKTLLNKDIFLNFLQNILPVIYSRKDKANMIFLIEYNYDCEDIHNSIEKLDDDIKSFLGTFEQQIFIY